MLSDKPNRKTGLFLPVPHQRSCSVVIPHLNDLPRLTRCLDALMPQIEEGDEVIVVDNGSDIDLSEALETYGGVQILHQPTPGAGPARNLGADTATSEILLFVDCDCVPATDWVRIGRDIAEPGKVVGGRVDIFDETPPPRSGAEAFEAVFAFKMNAYLVRDGFLGAGNLCVMRDDFARTGGFRPAVSEDVEWSGRAKDAGLTLAFDEAFAVAHPSRKDWPALRAKWVRLTREAYLLRRQEGASMLGWSVKALAMPFSILAHTPRVLGAQELSGRERLAAFATLARLRMLRMVWMLGALVSPPAG